MITIRDLTDRINTISEKLALLPAFRWGRVETVSPLSVVLDGESDPITGVSVVMQPIEGDRVLVLLWNRRATVLGVSGTRPTMSGKWYQPSGGWDVVGWGNEQGTWRGTIRMDLPYPLPEGHTVQTSVAVSSGFTFINTSNCSPGSKQVSMRVMQISDGGHKALKQISWQIIPV